MNQGYIMESRPKVSRVFKVIHTEQEVGEELNIIVDFGGTVKDVFVYHKAYGVLRADMDIKSRLDVENFIEKFKSGKSNLLMDVTSGYHYHTVQADSEVLLDIIQERLEMKGFLAKLQDYEPVKFW
jgi:transcriptional regulator of NAD metabolism